MITQDGGEAFKKAKARKKLYRNIKTIPSTQGQHKANQIIIPHITMYKQHAKIAKLHIRLREVSRLLILISLFFLSYLVLFHTYSLLVDTLSARLLCHTYSYNLIHLCIYLSAGNTVGSKLLGICLSDIWILHIGLASFIASMIVVGLAEDTIVIFLCAFPFRMRVG